MNTPTSPVPCPLTDEALKEMRARYTVLNEEAARLWKLKNQAAEDWYVAQVKSDELKKEIEREETCRAWFEQFQAGSRPVAERDETAAPAVGEL